MLLIQQDIHNLTPLSCEMGKADLQVFKEGIRTNFKS